MRKGDSVIGQPVYGLADGIKVDSVKDLVLEDGEDGVVALLVSEGGLLGTSTVVPFRSVVRFGRSAVMIDNAASVIPAASDARVNEILGRQGTLLGRRVISDLGEDLGTVADLYFDEASGRVTGYEVSGGVIGDAMHGSSYLPFDQIKTIGADAVIAVSSAREFLDPQKAGLLAAVDHIGTSVAEGHPAAPGDGGGPSDPAAADPDGAIVGAWAQRDVTDRDGSVIVAAGQRVTLDLVQRARSEGGLDPLYAAVGRPRPAPVSEQANEVVAKAAETASDLWARFTTKLTEMTDAAGQRLDTAQTKARLDAINDAIGRPVTKVFLDREDSVILDLGDLVTHQAVQRADEAGLLDSLLASVYKASDITFAREEMRARIEGDSTVDKAFGGASVVSELEAKLEHPSIGQEPVDDAAEPHEDGEPSADEATSATGTPPRDEGDLALRAGQPITPRPGSTARDGAASSTGRSRTSGRQARPIPPDPTGQPAETAPSRRR